LEVQMSGESVTKAGTNERIARLEVKLDHATVQHSDQEARIRRLERAFWIATGCAASFGSVVGAILTNLVGG
jgi:hypothetical protein